MSIDVNWDSLTGGSDGQELAEKVRLFIDDKFQQVALPRFIRSVKVRSFDFGSVSPEIEVKDVCDPLPDFYDDDEDDEDDEDVGGNDSATVSDEDGAGTVPVKSTLRPERPNTTATTTAPLPPRNSRNTHGVTAAPGLLPHHDLSVPLPLRATFSPTGPLSPRAATPGIPGGTSNLSYFHMPLSHGLSGTATPLAAVAGANFQTTWPEQNRDGTAHRSTSVGSLTPPSISDPNSRPPSQHRHDGARRSDDVAFFAESQSSPALPAAAAAAAPEREKSAEDIQVVSHVRYSGDIKMSLAAEILLDYPMPSFVGIPLQLNITGLTFDGVAILAHIRRRVHVCFLSPDDADGLEMEGGGDDDGHHHLGAGAPYSDRPTTEQKQQQQAAGLRGTRLGGLFEEIKVESEIGQKDGGRQVLKNVGKVEKFVLEQVRRIFEEEFVYPSFWTFLV